MTDREHSRREQRSGLLPLFLVSVALALSCSEERVVPAATATARTDRPSVVFILTDDLGWGDLGSYGHPLLRTPHLDRLAAEGTSLRQFYVNSPACSPSRTAFLTGAYPARHRVHRIFAGPALHRRFGMPDWLDPDVLTIADVLRSAGYATAHFGKWHLSGRKVPNAPRPTEYGFDESSVLHTGAKDELRHGAQSSDVIVDQALRFIEARRDEPFFAVLWTVDPHAPLDPTPEELARYDGVSVDLDLFEGTTQSYLAEAPDIDSKMQVYGATVTAMDAALGRLFDGLDELGVADDTLVLFTSDNGPEDYHVEQAENAGVGSTGPFRARKRSLYEGGVRVPCIVRWPGRVPAGRVDETSVVAGIDLFPTLCALAGIDAPDGLDGEDVGDVLRGATRARRDALLWDRRGGVAGSQAYLGRDLAIRDGDWKLLVQPDGTGAELYDLKRDPGEARNLAADEPELVGELSARVRAWRETLP